MGDGNFHVTLVFDGNNVDELKRVKQFSTILAQYDMIQYHVSSFLFLEL